MHPTTNKLLNSLNIIQAESEMGKLCDNVRGAECVWAVNLVEGDLEFRYRKPLGDQKEELLLTHKSGNDFFAK